MVPKIYLMLISKRGAFLVIFIVSYAVLINILPCNFYHVSIANSEQITASLLTVDGHVNLLDLAQIFVRQNTNFW